jgi:transposase-like protein
MDDLCTIQEAADELEYSVATLREWRRTWPAGARLGPEPLLISRRRLRYRRSNVTDVKRALIAAAEAANRR